jgi:hypothetical protein
MIIKPIDVLYMLDDEDLATIESLDLNNLCVAISLDLQLKQEENERESISNRRSLH